MTIWDSVQNFSLVTCMVGIVQTGQYFIMLTFWTTTCPIFLKFWQQACIIKYLTLVHFSILRYKNLGHNKPIRVILGQSVKYRRWHKAEPASQEYNVKWTKHTQFEHKIKWNKVRVRSYFVIVTEWRHQWYQNFAIR